MNKERPARDAGNNFPCVEFHHGAGEWNKGRHREKSLARNLNGREEAAGSTSSRLSLDRQWTSVAAEERHRRLGRAGVCSAPIGWFRAPAVEEGS